MYLVSISICKGYRKPSKISELLLVEYNEHIMKHSFIDRLSASKTKVCLQQII